MVLRPSPRPRPVSKSGPASFLPGTDTRRPRQPGTYCLRSGSPSIRRGQARSGRHRASHLSVEGPKSLACSGADLGGSTLFRGRAFSFKARDLRLEVLVPYGVTHEVLLQGMPRERWGWPS
jgi:hypothetical protein